MQVRICMFESKAGNPQKPRCHQLWKAGVRRTVRQKVGFPDPHNMPTVNTMLKKQGAEWGDRSLSRHRAPKNVSATPRESSATVAHKPAKHKALHSGRDGFRTRRGRETGPTVPAHGGAAKPPRQRYTSCLQSQWVRDHNLRDGSTPNKRQIQRTHQYTLH